MHPVSTTEVSAIAGGLLKFNVKKHYDTKNHQNFHKKYYVTKYHQNCPKNSMSQNIIKILQKTLCHKISS